MASGYQSCYFSFLKTSPVTTRELEKSNFPTQKYFNTRLRERDVYVIQLPSDSSIPTIRFRTNFITFCAQKQQQQHKQQQQQQNSSSSNNSTTTTSTSTTATTTTTTNNNNKTAAAATTAPPPPTTTTTTTTTLIGHRLKHTKPPYNVRWSDLHQTQVIKYHLAVCSERFLCINAAHTGLHKRNIFRNRTPSKCDKFAGPCHYYHQLRTVALLLF